MATAEKHLPRRSPRFQVGDNVRFTFGVRTVVGRIIEDRGPIGVGGRRLYVVEVWLDPTDRVAFEMPEDELEKDA